MPEQKTDRRVQRTQQLMRDALVELMLEKSYEKITIQEIIDRANIGRATFYNHYQDKDDLLLRGVAEIAEQDEPAEPADPTPQGTAKKEPLQTIRTVGMFEHARQNERIHQVMFKRNRENPILEKVTRFLYNRIEEQLDQLAEPAQEPSVPIPVLAQFLAGGLLSLIQWWHDEDFPYTPAEMDHFFQLAVMPGIYDVLKIKEAS